MKFSKVYSAQTRLLDAEIIDIEVDLSTGLHSFKIVGLPDKAVEESISRVSSAIKNSGFKSPKQKNEKVVVSLAPANIRKTGPLFDLAIAVCYLKATGDIKLNCDDKIFLGELSLDGKLRRVRGILPIVRLAKNKGFKEIFIPKENLREASIIKDIKVYGVERLQDLIYQIKNPNEKILYEISKLKINPIKFIPKTKVDLSDIKGQFQAKRGLEIAGAGHHNIALFGPPGTGKSLLAKAFGDVLPPLDLEEILDVSSIHSISGTLGEYPLIAYPPFRSPHHSSSHISICGGGSSIKAGEITLAHKGVLCMDELPEFDKKVINSLRQPLEDKYINISRVSGSTRFPSDFILITTMNPCPCGYYQTNIKQCTCTFNQIKKYRSKISGPIIDRIDLWIEVGNIEYSKIINPNKQRSESEDVKNKIEKARKFGKYNESLKIKKKAQDTLIDSAKNLNLSARAFKKVIKVARTIANLDESQQIETKHILEALQYRPKF